MGKNAEKNIDNLYSDQGRFFSEFITIRELSLLIGIGVKSIYNQHHNYDYDKIDHIRVNGKRYYNYYQAAKMAYPYLNDLDLAKLRLDLHAKVEELNKKCLVEKTKKI